MWTTTVVHVLSIVGTLKKLKFFKLIRNPRWPSMQDLVLNNGQDGYEQ